MKVGSFLWVMSDFTTNAMVSIATMLVLARIVGPREFGASAMILGVVLLVNIFVESLFHDALIQSREAPEPLFEQAMTLVLMIAGVLISVTLLAALLLATTPMARYGWYALEASVLLAFSGPAGIANARLRRDLQFADVAKASVLGRTFGCVAGIAIAWAGFGVVGLIAQSTLGSVAQATFLFATGRWKPKLRVPTAALGPLLRYALPNAFRDSVVAARLQLFALLVAALLGLAAAGFVNVAFRLALTPQFAILATLTNLCFPYLSLHQESRQDLEHAFELCSKLIVTVTLPLFAGLALVADDLTPVILGPDWAPCVPLVKLVAIGSALSFLRLSSSLALRARGNLRYSLGNAVFQLVVTLGGLLLFRPADPFTAVCCWIAPIVIQLPATWIVISRTLHMPLNVQLRGVSNAVAGTIAMVGGVHVIRFMEAGARESIRLVDSVTGGAVIFVAATLILDRGVRDVVIRGMKRPFEPAIKP